MGSHEFHDMQETSLQAYDEIQEKLGERQKEVLKAIQELCKVQGDATDSEIANHLMKQDPNYVRPRRFELARKFRLIEFSQQRVCKMTFKTCIAWKIRGGTNEKRKMPEVPQVQIPDQTFEDRTSQATIRAHMQEVSR